MKWFKYTFIIFVAIILSACNPLNKSSKSGLQVITDGVASSAYLDGQYLEKTPFINREIKPGEYTLKLQPDDPNLYAYELKVNLRPGLLTVVTWKLAQRPELSGGVVYEMEPIQSKSKSEVSFISIPDGAIVELNGRGKEFSPVIMTDVNPGHNEFEISLPSYESQKHTINVVEGYRMLVNVKLAKVVVGQEENQPVPSSTPVATPTPVTTPTPTPTTQANADSIFETPTPTASSTKIGDINNQDGKLVLINSTGFFEDNKEVSRVRDAPSSSGAELGFAVVGQKYSYLGNTTDNWHNISFESKSGWVSGSYSSIVNN